MGGGPVVGVPGDIKSANKINVKLSNNINKKSRIKRNKQSHLWWVMLSINISRCVPPNGILAIIFSSKINYNRELCV